MVTQLFTGLACTIFAGIYLQTITTLEDAAVSGLLERGEKLTVVGILCLLAWTLHRQNERREEKISGLYEGRITDLKQRIEQLQRELEDLKP